MKHFEGKLTVKPYSVILEDENGDTFAGALKLCPQEEGHQHALHLASCWNAMEGMEPEALEEAIRASDSVLRFHRYVGSFYNLGPNEAAEMREICAALSKALRRLRKEGV